LPPNLRRQVTNLSLLINVTLGILVLAMLIAGSISPILQKRATILVNSKSEPLAKFAWMAQIIIHN
ncbi:hypothetical protein TI04_10830, partial [Achromatium sp. WMS2]